jgi:hypothetical protein
VYEEKLPQKGGRIKRLKEKQKRKMRKRKQISE